MRFVSGLLGRCVILLALAGFAASVSAKTVSIDAGKPPYNSVGPAQNVDVTTDVIMRLGALSSLAAAYRAYNGVFSLPPGSIIKVKWANGSSEQATVTCLAGSECAVPIPGTQSGGGGGGGGYAGGGGGDGGGGIYDDCISSSETVSACTSAGGGKEVCTNVSIPVLLCPNG